MIGKLNMKFGPQGGGSSSSSNTNTGTTSGQGTIIDPPKIDPNKGTVIIEVPKGTSDKEKMDIREFSKANRKRSESPEGFNHKLCEWSTSDWFMALTGELGEAANVAKKLNRRRSVIHIKKLSVHFLYRKITHFRQERTNHRDVPPTAPPLTVISIFCDVLLHHTYCPTVTTDTWKESYFYATRFSCSSERTTTPAMIALQPT